MPIYEIENTDTGEIFEVMMKIDDKEKMMQKNPHFRQVPQAPNINKGGVLSLIHISEPTRPY